MPDRTVNEITDAAYRKNGIRKPSSAQDGYALEELQDMLSSWSADGLVVPFYVTENFTLTSSQSDYTIGLTTDSPDLVSSTGRPLRVTNMYIRENGGDTPLSSMTKDEYSDIYTKASSGRPAKYYYNPQYPNGKIVFDRQCDSAYSLYIVSEKPLTEVSAITDTLSLPTEINRALVYNLAIGLGIELKSELNDDVRRIAIESKEIIERTNASEKMSDPVKLDSALTSFGGNGYVMNINRGN